MTRIFHSQPQTEAQAFFAGPRRFSFGGWTLGAIAIADVASVLAALVAG